MRPIPFERASLTLQFRYAVMIQYIHLHELQSDQGFGFDDDQKYFQNKISVITSFYKEYIKANE